MIGPPPRDQQSWKELFEDLRERRLRGVEFAVTDAHEGLKEDL
jgi:transposase-like protein